MHPIEPLKENSQKSIHPPPPQTPRALAITQGGCITRSSHYFKNIPPCLNYGFYP